MFPISYFERVCYSFRRTDLLIPVGIMIILAVVIVRIICTPPGYDDESYQALCVVRWNESPLALYTFWKASIWTRIFGDSYISLRIFVSLIVYTGIFITSLYYGWRVNSWRKAAWMFVLTGLMAGVEAFVMYNWDGAPVILYAVGGILSLEYLRCQRLWVAACLGLITALLALSRIQLVGGVAVGIFFVWYVSHRTDRTSSRSWVATAIFLSVCFGTLTGIILLTMGSPVAYFESFQTDNIVTGHSIHDLHRFISNFGMNLTEMTERVFMAFMVVMVSIWLSISQYRRIKVATGMGVLVFVSMCMTTNICDSVLMDAATAATVPIIVSLFFMPFLHKIWYGTPSGISWIALITVAMWYLIPAFGSDMFSYRLNGFLIFPLLMLVGAESEPGEKRFIQFLYLSIFVAFGFSCLFRSIIMPVMKTERIEESSVFKGIRVDKEYSADYHLVEQLTRSVICVAGRDNVSFFGGRYMYCYAMNKRNFPFLHKFHTLSPQREAELYTPMIDDHDAWILLGVYRHEIDVLERTLESKGFERVYDMTDVGAEENNGHVMYIRSEYADEWRETVKSDSMRYDLVGRTEYVVPHKTKYLRKHAHV